MFKFNWILLVVLLLVVGCVEIRPVTTPTPAPPTPDVQATVNAAVKAALTAAAQAPTVTPSFAAVSTAATPTATAKPVETVTTKAAAAATPTRGTASPSPTPATRARVVGEDGTVFDLANVRLEEYWSRGGICISGCPRPFDADLLELYKDPTTIQISLDKIKTIERSSAQGEHTVKFAISLLTGERLEGEIGRYTDAEFLDCQLKGRITVEGYPSEFLVPFDKVASVVFTPDEQGNITAIVNTDDGTRTTISEPKCLMHQYPVLSGTNPTVHLKLRIGVSTLEIPVADIAKIVIGEKETTLTLRSGKELAGQTAVTYYLSGETTVMGLPATFHEGFGVIKSVTFQ
ncbi:MAG: hypothetical protein HY741_01195 [Chloroflexi bacterium]|nr:hypothetical protein [Chloroflexota bacterium]